jgi:hypothetical protein
MGHLAENTALIDLDIEEMSDRDAEETDANAFAMALLTGRTEPTFEVNQPARNAAQLAQAVRFAAPQHRIDPGVLAMSYGYHTDRWDLAYGALKVLYGEPQEIWRTINRFAAENLHFDRLTQDQTEFLIELLELSDER